MIIIYRNGTKKLVIGIIVTAILVALAFYPILYRLGIRYERMTEKEAPQDLSTKTFFDFFDGFGVYTENQTFPFLYGYYSYLGTENNFTNIGSIYPVFPLDSEETLYFVIYFATEDLIFRNITLFLAQDFNEQLLSELNIMILGNGRIYYYETDIAGDIVVKFTTFVTEISVVIF